MTGGPGDWRDLWRNLLPKRQIAMDIEDEIAFHIEEEVEGLVQEGVPEAEARDRTLHAFGDMKGARAQMSAIAGDGLNLQRLENMMEGLVRDLRLAARGLMRRPGFSGVVILTLALGIGANTAVFSVLNSILLRPLPFHEPDRLVRIYEEVHKPSGEVVYNDTPLTGPAFLDLREATDLFQGVAAFYSYRELGADITGGDRPERIIRMPISSNFFQVLGVSPALGRSFAMEEEREGVALAVISHGLWQSQFAEAGDVLGRSLELDGEAHEIIGVMPPGFRGPVGGSVEVWTPENLDPGNPSFGRGNHYLTAVARLAPGVSLEQAAARIETFSRGLAEEEGRVYEGAFWTSVTVPLLDDTVGGAKATLWVLMAAVGLVLLSTCVNVANLFLVRGLSRTREMAIRAALGAGKGGLLRHLLNESMILAVLGGGLGLGLAWGGIRFLTTLSPEGLPRVEEIGISPPVLIFTLVVSVLTGVIFGLTPMIRASSGNLTRDLRERDGGGGGRRSHQARSALVVAEVAVALVLLVGAGVLLRSFNAIRSVDLGIETEDVLTYEVHLPEGRYPDGQTRQAFYEELFPRVRALPGVETMASASWLPVNGTFNNWTLIRPGMEEGEAGMETQVEVRVLGGDYFSALDIDLIAGRYLGPEDAAGAMRSIVINLETQEQAFPGEDALGKAVRIGGEDWVIVGVVENIPIDAFGQITPNAYLPHAQFADDRNWPMIQTVAHRGDPGPLVQQIRRELEAVDPNLVLFRVRSLDEILDAALLQQRFSLLLMEIFAGMALLLAAVGIYGVLSYLVNQRKHEIGVRIALGAGAGEVRRMVVRQGLTLAGSGIVIGLASAFYLSRWLQALVFEVRVADPWVFGSVAFSLAGVAWLASYLPARRAARVDPAAAFRED